MINAVVEGASDEGVARAVIQVSGHDVGKVIVKGGKTRLDPDIRKYNQAARHTPWVVFRDSDNACPVRLRQYLLGQVGALSPSFFLRIVHPMTEGWLLADAAGATHPLRKVKIASDSTRHDFGWRPGRSALRPSH